jgi:inorganic pyrophosphatase
VQVDVIIEVPLGSRSKYEIDPATGGIRLDRMLFTSTRHPLDAMVLLGEPAFPGTSVTAGPVAVFWMHDEHGPDAKILTVPAADPRYQDVRDLSDVPAEISQFFDVYKAEPGKSSDVRGWQRRDAAGQEITTAHPPGRQRHASTTARLAAG